jgi:hypothetical protein
MFFSIKSSGSCEHPQHSPLHDFEQTHSTIGITFDFDAYIVYFNSHIFIGFLSIDGSHDFIGFLLLDGSLF